MGKVHVFVKVVNKTQTSTSVNGAKGLSHGWKPMHFDIDYSIGAGGSVTASEPANPLSCCLW